MLFSRFKEIGEVDLVHDSDLIDVLKKLNILTEIEAGNKKCKFTGEVITLDNFHAVFYENNDIKLVSNSTDAIKKFSEYLNKKES